MRSSPSALRAFALLASGALALHQLRYLLGYRGSSDEALASQGHAYFSLLGVLIVAALALAFSQFLAVLLRARRTAEAERSISIRRAWPAATAALLATYVVQESLEGALAPGHPAGMHGVFGHGGWAAILLAAVIGAVVAFLLNAAGKLIVMAASSRQVECKRRPERCWRIPRALDCAAPDVLARNLAGRAPPLLA